MEGFRVGAIENIYYWPDYLTPAEEAQLLAEVAGTKAWKQVSGVSSFYPNIQYP